MVKIYLKGNKKEYVDVHYSSILKAYVLGWLGLMGIVAGSYLFLLILLIFSFLLY